MSKITYFFKRRILTIKSSGLFTFTNPWLGCCSDVILEIVLDGQIANLHIYGVANLKQDEHVSKSGRISIDPLQSVEKASPGQITHF
jgi:hypothetical protein